MFTITSGEDDMRYSTILAGWLTTAAVLLLFGCGTGGEGLALDNDAPSIEEMKTLLKAEFDRLGIDPDKVPAQAPSGADNQVFDLAATVIDPDGEGGALPTAIELRFTERAVGDYDQNGEVNIADLTPLGVRFKQTVAYDAPALHGGIAYWPTGDPDDAAAGGGGDNWRKARIDGDFNTELNIADLTPIATHWNQRVSGYRVYRKAPSDTQFRMLKKPSDPNAPVTLSRPAVVPALPVRYLYSDEDIEAGVYEYFVSAYDITGANEGEPGNTVSANIIVDNPGNDPPVASLLANPASGPEPLETTLNASASSDVDGTIVKFEWDFDGNGTYDFDSGADSSVAHTYDTAGSFNPVVRVTDDGALTDTASTAVTVDVVLPNVDPTAALTFSPDEGDAPVIVNFDASGSNDPDGTIVLFEWDWTGDGSADDTTTGPTTQHTYNTQGNYIPKVRVTDNRGGTSAWASGVPDDNVIVHGTVETPPTAVLLADPLEGVAPLTVDFDAGDSFDDGPITKYEWDWEGDGTYEEDTGTTATNSHTYTENGLFSPTVRVTDSDALTDTDSKTITLEIHGWYIKKVATLGSSGKHLSFAIVNGNPAMAFWLENNGLHYIRALNTDGTGWPLYDEVIDGQVDTDSHSGQYNSLLVVNGNPAISYRVDVGSPTAIPAVRFVRATDADGAAWGAPIDIDSNVDGLDPGYPSMQIVSGNPAICYYDEPTSDLMYVRANDPDGSSWPAASPIYMNGTFNKFCKMIIANGNPAISFGNSDNSLKYIRANDANGSTWNSAVIIDPAGGGWFAGSESWLAIINGNPAVVYRHVNPTGSQDRKLFYSRAVDANGASWGAPVPLATSGKQGEWPSLATIEGSTPAVSYFDLDGGALKLRRADDANGTSWGSSPETVKNGLGLDSGYTSLQMVNGRITIAYYNDQAAGGKDLEFAIYFP